MKRHLLSQTSPPSPFCLPPSAKKGDCPLLPARPEGCFAQKGTVPFFRSGFTLVELLVVITIIGILTGLVTAAAVAARRRAKIATIVMEVKQLETACMAYKEKFGEYPPDFAGVDGSLDTGGSTTIQTAAQYAVLRHLARAFPRYQPGTTLTANDSRRGTFAGFAADVAVGWKLDVVTPNKGGMSPVSALTFWLGGLPNWLPTSASGTGTTTVSDGTNSVTILMSKPVQGFLGFAADPTNPFASSTTCASRINPMFDFDLSCLYYSVATTNSGLVLWPSNAYDASNANNSPMVYLRANNSTYFADGSTTTPRSSGTLVYPAIDTRLSNVPGTSNYNNAQSTFCTWVNPSSFQIFSSGQDTTYAAPNANGVSALTNCFYFPTGENYAPHTYDDITNFSNGTLEDAIP